jgi:hypothetical protein
MSKALLLPLFVLTRSTALRGKSTRRSKEIGKESMRQPGSNLYVSVLPPERTLVSDIASVTLVFSGEQLDEAGARALIASGEQTSPTVNQSDLARLTRSLSELHGAVGGDAGIHSVRLQITNAFYDDRMQTMLDIMEAIEEVLGVRPTRIT